MQRQRSETFQDSQDSIPNGFGVDRDPFYLRGSRGP